MGGQKILNQLVALAILAMCWSASAAPLKVLTLNLHGYHPMGESRRYTESRRFGRSLSDSRIFYFSRDEMEQGTRRQLDHLTRTIKGLQPDILLFQEVGAGDPGVPKTCSDFYSQSKTDLLGVNSVVRLHQRLAGEGYQIALACRGNTGWWTEAQTFANSRVVTESGKVVFDFNENPYPNGVLIEGFGLLVKSPWRIVHQEEWVVEPAPQPQEKAMVQMVVISHRDLPKKNILVLNMHGRWGFAHFEQAVAIREQIETYRGQNPQLNISDVIIGGDFNQELLRSASGAPGLIPFEVKAPNIFDFNIFSNKNAASDLRNLLRLQFGASVPEPRLTVSVDHFFGWQRSVGVSGLLQMTEAFDSATHSAKCLANASWDGACSLSGRIDHIFATGNGLVLKSAEALFASDNWYDLDGPSDHPGVLATYEVK